MPVFVFVGKEIGARQSVLYAEKKAKTQTTFTKTNNIYLFF